MKRSGITQFITPLLLLLFISSSVTAAAYVPMTNNLQIDGILVADPCELDPGTTALNVEFGTVIDKYLYLNQRTHSRPLVFRLKGCDLTLGNQVAITFKGTESTELPGLLATDQALSGIAIGLELPDGTALPVNKTLPAFMLSAGTTEITLNGYVAAEPSAIKNHQIQRGAFNAVATFELNYP